MTDIKKNEYKFPYHHLAYWDENGVAARQRGVPWGMEYLCYLRHAKEAICALSPKSLLDVGCGDGRLISLLSPSGVRCTGVDRDEDAIRYAQAFCPDSDLRKVDAADVDETFDVVSAIEVLEHIPDDAVPNFIRTLAERTKAGGHVIISVPSIKLPLNPKHYRHYSEQLLLSEIESSGAPLKIVRIEHIYRENPFFELMMRLTYNKHWIIEFTLFRRWAWNYVWRNLRNAPDGQGRHLFAILIRNDTATVSGA